MTEPNPFDAFMALCSSMSFGDPGQPPSAPSGLRTPPGGPGGAHSTAAVPAAHGSATPLMDAVGAPMTPSDTEDSVEEHSTQALEPEISVEVFGLHPAPPEGWYQEFQQQGLEQAVETGCPEAAEEEEEEAFPEQMETADSEEVEMPGTEEVEMPGTEEVEMPEVQRNRMWLAAERAAAEALGVRWQDRGPPGPTEPSSETWRGQHWRPGSERWANRGGVNREWWAAYYKAKGKSKGKGKSQEKGKGKGQSKGKDKGKGKSKEQGKSSGSSSSTAPAWT